MGQLTKMYIGDGIYAEVTEQGLVLTTEDGIEVTNRIVFEAREWFTLQEWLKEKIPQFPQ